MYEFYGNHGTEYNFDAVTYALLYMVLPRILFSRVPADHICLGDTLAHSEHALVVLYDTCVDNVPVVGGVFHDFWDILYGKERGRRVPRDEINNTPPFKPPPPPLLPPPPLSMSLWSCGMCRTVCAWLNDLITCSVGTLQSRRCACD